MALKHLDRLTALDASFLHQEGPEAYMHIGALAIIDGPAPRLDELLAHIGSRLHLVPRYRQRLARTPLDRGRPVWIDDPGFRLEFHVRHAALPAPGGREQLLGLLSRIFSAPLDRRRPLWELWFIEGLHDGGFALIFKTHHAVTDGVAGVDLATVVFDPDGEPPNAASAPPAGPRRATPEPLAPAHARRVPRRAGQRAPPDADARRGGASAAGRPAPGRGTRGHRRDRLGRRSTRRRRRR